MVSHQGGADPGFETLEETSGWVWMFRIGHFARECPEFTGIRRPDPRDLRLLGNICQLENISLLVKPLLWSLSSEQCIPGGTIEETTGVIGAITGVKPLIRCSSNVLWHRDDPMTFESYSRGLYLFEKISFFMKRHVRDWVFFISRPCVFSYKEGIFS